VSLFKPSIIIKKSDTSEDLEAYLGDYSKLNRSITTKKINVKDRNVKDRIDITSERQFEQGLNKLDYSPKTILYLKENKCSRDNTQNKKEDESGYDFFTNSNLSKDRPHEIKETITPKLHGVNNKTNTNNDCRYLIYTKSLYIINKGKDGTKNNYIDIFIVNDRDNNKKEDPVKNGSGRLRNHKLNKDKENTNTKVINNPSTSSVTNTGTKGHLILINYYLSLSSRSLAKNELTESINDIKTEETHYIERSYIDHENICENIIYWKALGILYQAKVESVEILENVFREENQIKLMKYDDKYSSQMKNIFGDTKWNDEFIYNFKQIVKSFSNLMMDTMISICEKYINILKEKNGANQNSFLKCFTNCLGKTEEQQKEISKLKALVKDQHSCTIAAYKKLAGTTTVNRKTDLTQTTNKLQKVDFNTAYWNNATALISAYINDME